MQWFQYWRRMLLLALSCRFNAQSLLNENTKQQQLFFSKTTKRKSERRKKRYASLKAIPALFYVEALLHGFIPHKK
jgi:hypothetical protein